MYGIIEYEPKFKVGDRVQTLVAWGEDAPIGSLGTVHKLVDDRGVTVKIDGGDGFGWYYAWDDVAAAPAEQVQPKYKVGQRVRFTDAIDSAWWFKAGEVGVIEQVNPEFHAATYAVGLRESHAFVSDCHIEPAFLPGDKVRVTRCNGYFAAGDEGVVEKQGKYNVFVKHGPYQRVGLPIEAEKLELVEAVESQPKFKSGDRVTTSGANGNPGVGTVLGYDSEGAVRVQFDSAYGLCHEPEDWLTLASAADCAPRKVQQHDASLYFWGTPQPCIVALVKNGQPLPAHKPYIHPDTDSATTEAERLARNNPGHEFAVYQRVAGRQCEVSYEMKEVA